MFAVLISEKNGPSRRLEFNKAEVTIGRIQGNDIILPKGNVSKRHSRIVLKDERFVVVDLKSTNGTYVNGRRVTSPLVIKPGDKVYIGDFVLEIEMMGAVEGDSFEGRPSSAGRESAPAAFAPEPPSQQLRAPGSQQVRVPAPTFAQPPMPEPPTGGQSLRPPPARSAPQVTVPLDRPSSMPDYVQPSIPAPRLTPSSSFMGSPTGVGEATSVPIERAPAPRAGAAASASQSANTGSTHIGSAQTGSAHTGQIAVPQTAPAVVEERVALPPAETPEMALQYVFQRLNNLLPQALSGTGRSALEFGRPRVRVALERLRKEGSLASTLDLRALEDAALSEGFGLGALSELLEQESLVEVIVDGPNRMFADLGQGLKPIASKFSSVASLRRIAARLLAQGGAELEPMRGVQNVWLAPNTRVTVVHPPRAISGLMLLIKRAPTSSISLEALVTRGMVPDECVNILEAAIEGRKNIFVSGPDSQSIAQLLSALVAKIPPTVRIVCLEQIPQLVLTHPAHLRLGIDSAPSGLRTASAEAWALGCERMVIASVGPEHTHDLLLSVTARRAGSLVGYPALSPQDLLRVLGVLAVSTGVSPEAVPALIGEAAQMIVQLSHSGEAPQLVSITEVRVSEKGLQTRDLYHRPRQSSV